MTAMPASGLIRPIVSLARATDFSLTFDVDRTMLDGRSANIYLTLWSLTIVLNDRSMEESPLKTGVTFD